MPMQKHKYPSNWKDIAFSIKQLAEWKCQLCLKQCRKPDEQFDTHKRTLTVAHLDHDESNCDTSNLMAMCSSCHLRYDSRSKAEAKWHNGRKTPKIQEDLERVRMQIKRDKDEADSLPLWSDLFW